MSDDQEPDQADIELAIELDNKLIDTVMPLIDDLDEEYDGHAWFAVFVNCLHILLEQGWTKEELLKEVEQHHEIHYENHSQIENFH